MRYGLDAFRTIRIRLDAEDRRVAHLEKENVQKRAELERRCALLEAKLKDQEQRAARDLLAVFQSQLQELQAESERDQAALSVSLAASADVPLKFPSFRDAPADFTPTALRGILYPRDGVLHAHTGL